MEFCTVLIPCGVMSSGKRCPSAMYGRGAQVVPTARTCGLSRPGVSVCPKLRVRQPTAMPFGASLSASLACYGSRCFRQFTCVGRVLQPDSPTSLDAGSRGDFLTVVSSPFGRRCVVTAASDTTVASCAGAAGLLRTKPQVRLMVLSISNDYLSDFHVAPQQRARWSRR